MEKCDTHDARESESERERERERARESEREREGWIIYLDVLDPVAWRQKLFHFDVSALFPPSLCLCSDVKHLVRKHGY